eukprot:3290680-Lingulodinium_polyedra.AAC.1
MPRRGRGQNANQPRRRRAWRPRLTGTITLMVFGTSTRPSGPRATLSNVLRTGRAMPRTCAPCWRIGPPVVGDTEMCGSVSDSLAVKSIAANIPSMSADSSPRRTTWWT